MKPFLLICFFSVCFALHAQQTESLAIQKGHSGKVVKLAFSSDNQLVCSLSYEELIVWDYQSGYILLTQLIPDSIDKWINTASMKFEDNNSIIRITNSDKKRNMLFGLENESWKFVLDSLSVLKESETSFADVILRDNKLRVYEKRVLLYQRTCTYDNHFFTDYIYDQERGRLIVSCSDGKIYVYDYKTGQKIIVFRAHTGGINDLAISTDSKLLLSASNDRSIGVWELDQFTQVKRLFKPSVSKTTMAIDPEEKLLIVGAESGELFLFDLADLSGDFTTLDIHNATINSIEIFSRTVFFSASRDGVIKIYDITTNKELLSKKLKPVILNPSNTVYLLATIGYDRGCRREVDHSILSDDLIWFDYSWNRNPIKWGGGWCWSRDGGWMDEVHWRNIFKPSMVFDSTGQRLSREKFPDANLHDTIKTHFPLDSIFSIDPNYEYLQNNLYNHGQRIPLLRQDLILTISSDGHIYFWNKDEGNLIAKMFIDKDNHIIFLPDNYYMSLRGSINSVGFRSGTKYFSPEQFDLKYNRPDLVLKQLGCNDTSLLNAFRLAYDKRLKKLGFTEEMLSSDFHIPEIKVTNITEIDRVANKTEVTLNVSCNDDLALLDRIMVWVNDVAIYGTSGISIREKSVKQYEAALNIPLAFGKNKIQVSTLNQAGAESYKETIELECTAGKTQPDLYLLTVGVSNYKDSLYNLTYASKDAIDMVAAFRENKFYANVFSKTLTDQDVILENLIALKDFLKPADINDHVILFVAGHGVLDLNFDYYFASHDMDFQNPSKRGISYETIEALLDGIKPLKKLLLMDTCHSGEVDKDEIQVGGDSNESDGDIVFRNVGVAVQNKENQLGLQNTSELMKSLFTDLRKGTGATVISSAGGVEFAMESDKWQNGLFTYCFIDGLTNKKADLNKDKQITISEIQTYVQSEVNKLSGGKQTPTSRIENNELDYRVW